MRLHRGGRFRAWLGRKLGGDAALGDRAWRRVLHGLGALLLLYYLVPREIVGPISRSDLVLLGLAAVLVFELLRHGAGLELPTIRPHESGRPASFAFFAIALVVALFAFPEPIAALAIAGAALIDPLIGELRLRPGARSLNPALPIVAYGLIAVLALRGIGDWAWGATLDGAALAALLAVGVERLRYPYLDDDLTMPLLPGFVLTLLLLLWPSLPRF